VRFRETHVRATETPRDQRPPRGAWPRRRFFAGAATLIVAAVALGSWWWLRASSPPVVVNTYSVRRDLGQRLLFALYTDGYTPGCHRSQQHYANARIDRAATQHQRASTRGERRWQRGSTCAANRDVNSCALPDARWRLDCRPRERARWCVYRVAARRATNAATRRPAGVRAVSASRDGGRLFTDPVDAAPGALACATRGHMHGSAGLRSLAVSMSTRGPLAPRTLHSRS
jgi:hypothetical protein